MAVSMKRFLALFFAGLWLVVSLVAQEEVGSTAGSAAPIAADSTQTVNAAAAVVSGHAAAMPRTPDFLEVIVDGALELFDVKSSGNTTIHYIIAALLLVLAFLLRRVVTIFIFGFFRRLAARTKTTLDDKLFPALEEPVAALIVVTGGLSAMKVLKLSATSDEALGYATTIAYSLVLFWLFLRAFNTVLDHLQESAREKELGIAAFMPWIKKTLVAIFVVFGVLMIAQSLGADVKAFLAGLGIGGLAFALAAQDTIANVFGSIVVAIDQPFKLGEFVQIGSATGTVEDIGLRSTKLRTPQRTLIIIPNKAVASEVVNNFSRMPQRRVDLTIGLTYDTTPEQMETILGDIRELLNNEPGVHPELVLANFTGYGASSLDIQIIYFAADPNFAKAMELREAINLKIMRAVYARGLSFAFPTQTVHVATLPREQKTN
ncbi:MAG: mechanosensitive ion channel family protein [Opitutaceae bacterium]|jgi:MscS family membrane protein|nr:mechanosensitive ion channel family protein [Opitutaceae bacterium]MBP9912053.1 mechanosensitive ion channel family protein [Opitutaceae bacterium]